MNIKELRKNYLKNRSELEKEFLARSEPGEFLARHSALLDDLIKAAIHPFLNDLNFAIIAIGGYGRGEMLPHSDVDLLVVHNCLDSGIVKQTISPLITTLWDLIDDVGHQVWSMNDLVQLDRKEHYEFVLALRDGRYLAGDSKMAAEVMEKIFPEVFHGGKEFFIDIVHSEVDKRYSQQKFTIFHLEPDIKESPGGLRDHLAAGWLEDLAGEPAYLKHSREEVSSAHEFMLGVRILLHILSGRNNNRLNIDKQEKISFMGSPEAVEPRSHDDIRAAIESFMKRYYINARILKDSCKTMMDVSRPDKESRELDVSDLKYPADAVTVMELFIRAGKENARFSYQLKNKIAKQLCTIKKQIDFPELKDSVVRFFKPVKGMSALLWEMYNLGFLEVLFPEFSDIKARFCWDYYHRYTVDEHTLLAIRNIERLTPSKAGADSDNPVDMRFSSLLEESSNPVNITLALLFHDIGKGAGENHSVAGARITEKALKRFGFSKDEKEKIVFLVLHHLAMSTVVFHRDHNDHKVMDEFADLVSDTETLRCLTLLTYADVKAVGPGTLNNWKKDQLWDVYVKTYRKLTLGYGSERIDEDDLGIDRKLIKGLPATIDKSKFEEFLEGFPLSYLRIKPKRIYRHFKLASLLNSEHPVQSSISRSRGLYELCVVTPDRSRLFARIAGMLSYFDMNIVKGYGFDNNQDTVLDFFEFFDGNDRFRYTRERKRFQTKLHDVLTDRLSIREMLKQKAASPLVQKMGPMDPVVYFEDDAERRITLMEIISPDKPGLLYSIGSILSSCDCDIELLLINTEGEKAVDVFYLRHNNGILPGAVKEELKKQILGSL
jgi:[protein-PII] uridylyltransferase